MPKNILEVKNLNKYYVSSNGINHAVNNVSFSLQKGEVIGLIGQSGSGKTTVGRTLMRTLTETNGTINLDGKIYPNYAKSGKKSLPYKKKVQMIYQNPMDSLNGLRNIYSTLKEALDTHHILDESIKLLLKSKNDIKSTYEWEFKLLQAQLDRGYYIAKRKLILEHIEKFKLAKINGEIESYLYFEEEKLNKSIIKLLVELEEKFSDSFNERFDNYSKIITSYPEEAKVISSKKKLDSFLEEKKFVDDYGKLVKKELNKAERKIKDSLDNIKINLKLFKNTQKKLRKSFKEVSANQKDIFTSVNYKISEIIAYKNESIFNKILKIISEKNSTKTISSEKLNILLEEVTEKNSSKILKLTSEIATKEAIIANFKETMKEVFSSVENFDYDYEKYLVDKDFYRTAIIKKTSLKIKELDDKFNKLKDLDFSNEKHKSLVDKNRNAQDLFQKIKEKNSSDISDKIDELNKEINLMIEENDNMTKILDENAKEALNIFDENIKNKILKVKNKIEKLKDHKKIKELKLVIKTINIDAKNMKNKFKIKNQAYDLEKKILTKNIDKIKVICGLKKESIINSKRQYKEAVVTKRIYNTLKKVGLKPEHAYRYPHEFSGGQLQRVLIARALLVEPEVIIADEPIASLDISIQAQVINLLIDLVREQNISLIFIGHDLSTIEYLCDKLLVMHLGRVVERGSSKEIFSNPLHPYTKILFKSVPKISEANKKFELFTNINAYLTEWNRDDMPTYKTVKSGHEILANNIQWKAWNAKTQSSKKQATEKGNIKIAKTK